MRVFIGVELADGVKRAAGDAAESLRERLGAAHVHLDARWVSPEHHHITLWFIGEVDPPTHEAIVGALRPPFAVPAFTLEIGGLGAFPPRGKPRVLWLGVRVGGESLAALYRELARRLEPLGFAPEMRPYSAHLTIARVKDVPRAAVERLHRALASSDPSAGACTIAAVTLFRSRLSPRGAHYEPLLRVPLS